MKTLFVLFFICISTSVFSQTEEIKSVTLPDSSILTSIWQNKRLQEEFKVWKAGDTSYKIRIAYMQNPERRIKTKISYINNKVTERIVYSVKGRDSIIETAGADGTLKISFHIDSLSENKSSPPTIEAVEPIDNSIIYSNTDQRPVFIGGQQSLLEFVSENLKYPEDAEENGINGQVMVRFVVNPDGSVSSIEVMKSGNDTSLENAAMEVVKKTSGRWIPGKKAGIPVKVYCVLPIDIYPGDDE